MAFESLTDENITALLRCPKRVKNPQARNRHKDGHEQVNMNVVATDDSGHAFELFTRRNLRDGMEDDFSCGLRWLAPNGETLMLARYNGPGHNHPNHLENQRLGYTCHIHHATERYIRANRKAEGFAEATARYTTVEGALHCLTVDCNISGITTTADNTSQPSLFDE